MKNTPWKVHEHHYPPTPAGPDGITLYDIRGCDDWCILPDVPKDTAYALVSEVNERQYLLDLIRRMIECFEGTYFTARLPAKDAFNLLSEARAAIGEDKP